MSASWDLEVVECDEDADAFRTLGGASFKTRRAQMDAWAVIPEVEAPPGGPRSWVVDRCDDDGNLIGEREISEATACALLGVESLDDLRTDADRRTNEAVHRWLIARSAPSSVIESKTEKKEGGDAR